jgi:hypothetical protein
VVTEQTQKPEASPGLPPCGTQEKLTMTTPLTQEEKDLRRRLRDALLELRFLAGYCNLVYISIETGFVEVKDVDGQLVFEVYDDYEDDNEQPTYITASTTDEQLKRYHIEIWAEKSTMNYVLQPLARNYKVNLSRPSRNQRG